MHLSEYAEVLARYRLAMVLDAGYFATGIFFCLSGYGLTISIQRHGVDRAFVWRHMRKLLLPYIAFWLLYTLFALVLGHELPLVVWMHSLYFFSCLPLPKTSLLPPHCRLYAMLVVFLR